MDEKFEINDPQAEMLDDTEINIDEENSQEMTASYSEISFRSVENEPLPIGLNSLPIVEQIQRPVSLVGDQTSSKSTPFHSLQLEGTVHIEGNMTHFVTEDLEYKIKLSSPSAKRGIDTPSLPGSSKNGTPGTLYRQILTPQVSLIDTTLLTDIELEAQQMATSIDNLTENLCGILHSISSITADNVDIYKDAVSKVSDSMDSNIKSIYTIMAKAEEVTQAMKSIEVHVNRIKEIKRLVEHFESCI